MDDQAQVTFLMPVWNAGPYLAPAIESVLAQTDPRWRLIVVDDRSTDGSADVAASFDDERIRLIRLPENLGQTGALNQGLAAIETPWTARVDQDDVAAPERVARQLAYLEAHPGTVLLGSWADVIDDSGKRVGSYRPSSSPEEVRRDLYAHPEGIPLAHSAVVFDTRVAREVGGYPPELTIAQDYGLWVGLARRGAVANVPEPLVSLRRHESQTSGSREAELRTVDELLEVAAGLGEAFSLSGRERRAWQRARLRLVTQRAIAASLARNWPRARSDTADVARGAVANPAVVADVGVILWRGLAHRARTLRGA